MPTPSTLSSSSPAAAVDCASTGLKVPPFQENTVLGTAFELTQRYTDLAPIGIGVSGLVCSARDLNTKTTVAVKKVKDPFRTALTAKLLLREIQLLRYLRHENVVNLTDIFISPSEDIYIITKYLPTDLEAVLEKGPIPEKHAQFFFYQIMRGLKYIHSAGVIHRDLKPANLLVDDKCDLQICDFGLARVQEASMTGYVSTRFYRAPEVMLSWKKYTEKVDIWSAACILAEMLLGTPLFPGKNHVHQFTLITELRGKPPRYLLRGIERLPDHEAKSIAEVIPGIGPDASDILEHVLVFDPKKRPSARDILESTYLAPYHDPDDEQTADGVLDSSFLNADRPLGTWRQRVYAEILGFDGQSVRN